MRLSGPFVALVAAGALLGACTSESPGTVSPGPGGATATQSSGPGAPSASPSPVVTQAPAVSARKVADAIAVGGDLTAARGAVDLTAADSLAHAFMLHRAYVAEAVRDSGVPDPGAEVTALPAGKFKSCEDPADETTCTVFGDFRADGTGKIVDFTVNGKPLQGRLTVGDGQQVKAGGGTFTFLTAYQAIPSNSLIVTIKTEPGKKSLSPDLSSASYRGPDGKQRAATDAIGPTRVRAHKGSVTSLRFDGVQPGGEVVIEGCIDDQCEGGNFKALIPVR